MRETLGTTLSVICVTTLPVLLILTIAKIGEKQ
jgi:hypothetical protein